MIEIGVAASVVGLAVGSFITTAALRATQDRQALTGRSACDHCGVRLGYDATLPVVSYLARRGACTDCGAGIDVVHPLGEVAGALIVGSSVLLLPPLQAVLAAGLGLTLLASAVIDAKIRRLPDVLTVVIAGLALVLASSRGVEAALSGVLAALVGVIAMVVLRWIAGRGGRDPALGFGDVKLTGALALWLGLATPWAIAAAAILGLAAVGLLRPSDRRISFGPALAAAAWTVGLLVQAGLWPV